MKTFNPLYLFLLVFALLVVLFSCEETDDFEKYEPQTLTLSDSTLVYADLVTYPYLSDLTIDTPKVGYSGAHTFVLDSIKEISGKTFNRTKFKIDRATGVITYTNAGELLPGTYQISVGLTTISGFARFDSAVTLKVLEVPLELTLDNAAVEAGSLQLGVIAKISPKDLSAGDITEVSYAFTEPKDGFEIDKTTGEISKIGSVLEKVTTFSVKATTNVGIRVFENVLTVTVGEAPTLKYVQQDGATDLHKVTLSPWTAYTTGAPVLSGMEAGGGYQIKLPDTLAAFASNFSFDASGKMSIAKGASLPEGEHTIGVTVTNNGGVAASFDSMFVLNVVAQWESEPFIAEDFNDPETANVLPEDAYPGLWSQYVFSGDASNTWKKVTDVGSGLFAGMRRFNPKDADAGLVRAISLADVYGLKFSFGEMLGYGPAFITNYDRVLYYGDDLTNASAGTFDAADWNEVLGSTGPWLDANWNGGAGPAQDYSNLSVDLSKVQGDTLYIMWRLMPSANSSLNQNGQWIIDYFSAERASAYEATEE